MEAVLAKHLEGANNAGSEAMNADAHRRSVGASSAPGIHNGGGGCAQVLDPAPQRAELAAPRLTTAADQVRPRHRHQSTTQDAAMHVGLAQTLTVTPAHPNQQTNRASPRSSCLAHLYPSSKPIVMSGGTRPLLGRSPALPLGRAGQYPRRPPVVVEIWLRPHDLTSARCRSAGAPAAWRMPSKGPRPAAGMGIFLLLARPKIRAAGRAEDR